jgi:hypothetical protein
MRLSTWRWTSSSGPIARSQRIRLTGASTEELLLVHSAEEAFPEDVVNEIRQERNADDLHLPPCAVELVLGLGGDQRLFVVLPAGTDVDLPFSINAPFLQDPARQKIKEPEGRRRRSVDDHESGSGKPDPWRSLGLSSGSAGTSAVGSCDSRYRRQGRPEQGALGLG